MKKLLSLALALALTLSLAAPALAAEAQTPIWQEAGYVSLDALLKDFTYTEAEYYASLAAPHEQKTWIAAWLAAHPGGADSFDADAYFAAAYSGYDGKADYMSTFGLDTEEAFYNDLLCAWIYDSELTAQSQSAWAAVQAQQPERTALFLSQLDAYIDETLGYSSMEALMADGFYFSSPEEVYLSLFEDWNDQWQQEQEAAAARNALIASLGGVPGQINVMVGRRCLSFGARAPKLVDGALSVPADLLEKTLGTPVKGDAEGYAPLRSTAEAAGWDVLWDQEHQTALLLDKKAFIAQLDKNYTQLNSLLTRLLDAVKAEAGQSYRTQGEVDISFTLFDSLDGDKTYDLHFQGELYHKDGALSGKLTMDLSSLMGLVTADQVKQVFGEGLSLSKLTGLLKACTVEFILNPETEMLYVKMPMLAQLMSDKVPQLGQWISIPMAGYGDLLDQPDPAALSVGSVVYDQAYRDADSYWSDGAIYFYTVLDRLTQSYTAVVGNSRFTEQNGALTYRMDTKTANDLWKQMQLAEGSWYGDTVPDLFRSCDITLSVGQSGKITAKADVRLNSATVPLTDLYLPTGTGDFQLRLDATRTTEHLKTGLELHWQNRFTLTLTETDAFQKTDTAPLSAPPQGAEVVDMDTLGNLISAALA